jgi:CHAT domain-containing protein/tetratricopeptide (TPR) repeat protein
VNGKNTVALARQKGGSAVAVSVSERIALSCGRCGHDAPQAIWKVIEMVERPDLVAALHRGELHRWRCARCGDGRQWDGAMLLVDLAHGAVLFISRPDLAGDEYREQRRQLAALLQSHLPSGFDTSVNVLDVTYDRLKGVLDESVIESPACRDGGPGAEPEQEPEGLLAYLGRDAQLAHLVEEAQAAADRFTSAPRVEALQAVGHVWKAIFEHAVAVNVPEHVFQDLMTASGEADITVFKAGAGRGYLDRAINTFIELDAKSSGTERRGDAANNLGAALKERYTLESRREDLDASIDHLTRGLRNAPISNRLKASLFTNLGVSMKLRSLMTSSGNDLDMALVCYEQAVGSAPPEHAPAYINNLANGLLERYYRRGDLDDLDRATAGYRQALAATSPGDPRRPHRLTNLGLALMTRHRVLGTNELKEAVPLLAEAVDLTPAGSPDRAARLTNLALTAIGAEAPPNTVAAAVGLMEEVVTLTPEQSPFREYRVRYLATLLLERHRKTGREEDLTRAIALLSTAIGRHGDVFWRDRFPALGTLAEALACRYQLHRDPADWKQATEHWRSASNAADASTQSALAAARAWGDAAFDNERWDEATAAYARARAFAADLFSLQLTGPHKQALLRPAQGLGKHYAFALMKSTTPDAEAALIAIEDGSARLLRYWLDLNRSDLEKLRSLGHGDLYERYVSAMQQLSALHAGGDVGGDTRQDEGRRRSVHRELQDIVAEIGDVPGYRQLFAGATLPRIRTALEAATNGPVRFAVYLALTRQGGLALILDASAIAPVWFECKPADVSQVFSGKGPAGRGYFEVLSERLPDAEATDAVLDWLGSRIMQPIFDAVSTRASRAQHDKPHVTLVVNGLLSMLPLHAARILSNGSVMTVSDAWTVSYSPSARALEAQGTGSGDGTSPQTFLGIADPSPPAHLPSLPCATAEVKTIGQLFGSGSRTLCQSAATRAAVEFEVTNATHLHFSCHGRFDAGNPRESAILLADGEPWSVGNLMVYRRLAGKQLVTLASCETALTDFSELPDEAIGLPLAFIHSGVPSVVGSLWPVEDFATMFVMIQFYERHRAGAEGSAALNAAQLWLRDVRRTDLIAFCDARAQQTMDVDVKSAFESAAARLLAGTADGDDDCPFADACYWAPYVFVGH